MKHYCMAAVLSALAACGGTGGTGVTTALTPQGLVGRTFNSPTVSSQVGPNGNSSDPVWTDNASVKFTSTTSAIVQIAGQPGTTVTLNNQGYFEDASGNLLLEVFNSLDGVNAAQDMLYFVISDFRFNGGSPFFRDTFVQGNRTAAASMPTSGVATYFGTTAVQDGTDAVVNGNFNLAADFSTSTLTGSLSAILPADTTATFDLVPVAITGNGFSTTLTTTSAITINTGQLNGNFYGPGASEVGGTILLDTSIGNAAGVFGGFKQ